MRDHDRIEALAGAIALGEASDEERRAYREHVSLCKHCLEAFGGEREIERVAQRVIEAREAEIWQPQLPNVVTARVRRSALRWQYACAVVLAASATGAALHAVLPSTSHTPPVAVANLASANAATSAAYVPQKKTATDKAVQAQAHMIVQHNIVQIARAPVAPLPAAPVLAANITPAPIADVTVHAQPPRLSLRRSRSNIPIWRRGDPVAAWRTVATTTTTSLSETAPQAITHRAELLQVASQHIVRDAAPIGGETAITPHPSMIAYDEEAQGTSVFEVLIDERGNPTRCVITKSSGYAVLDVAVCKAAMQVRYSPKTVDGRAVSGVYNDAFTFRMSDNQEAEGIPKPIQ